MQPIQAFLVHLDNAWDHEYESLLTVLDGVTEEEANWQAPCYADVKADDGWPAPGTIRWHVAHVAYYKREYTARISGPDGDQRTPSPPLPTGAYREDLEEMGAAHKAQREAISALTPEELTPDVADFLANIIRHDIWHAGSIAVLRRLWRSRSPD